MKVQEVILRAMAKRITWWQAAEIIWRLRGVSDMRGLARPDVGYPRRRNEFRWPDAVSREVFRSERGVFFRERREEPELHYGKLALQGAGLVPRGRKRGVHSAAHRWQPSPRMA